MRNPKDQMVSWYKFFPNRPQGQDGSWKTMLHSGWDKYFEHVIAGIFSSIVNVNNLYKQYLIQIIEKNVRLCS